MSVRTVIVTATSIMLLAGACTGGVDREPRPTEEAPVSRTERAGDAAPPPVACTSTAATPQQARADLGRAVPGQTLCFEGPDLADLDLTLTASGTPRRPITLVGRDTTVRSLSVESDHVVVDGFTTRHGEGLALGGTAIIARGNTVLDARDDGISCVTCTDTLITDNVVRRADGTGILVEGERISVLGNDVSGSVMREANDADGIRFFGSGHRISDNKIHDISDDGYPDPPHTDCFQTYDNSSPPTVNVEISRNSCTNVDHQCLIATAEEAGRSGAVGRSHSLRFVGNTCAVEGSQAVLVRWFPDVKVRNNDISGRDLARGVILLDKSTSSTIVGNRFRGDYPMFEVDPSSRNGLRTGGNKRV